jgi:hypothetical protein
LKITEIVFYSTNRAKLVVEIPDNDAYTTSEVPRIPRILFKLFPHMATQRCYNDGGYSFRREAQATEIPHLLEHLILEIQDQVRRGVGTPFAGETQWNWTVDPRGRFYVTVDYDNELVALGAIRLAERVINALDSKEIAQVDMNREIGRLRELAKLSRRFVPTALRERWRGIQGSSADTCDALEQEVETEPYEVHEAVSMDGHQNGTAAKEKRHALAEGAAHS